MAIPLPLVYKTRLPLMRKIQLFLLFCVSTLIIIISIIRMPVIVGAGSLQKSRTLWASIEVMVGCFVANAPILNSFLHTIKNAHASRIGSRSTSRKHPYTANTDERKRVRMPVTGQNSFGSLTRHDGNESVHDMVWKDDFALGTRLTSMQTHGTPAPMAELESKVSWGKKDWTVEGKDLRVAGS